MNLLDSMRYLVALEQHRHFGRAASACHITQPALSNALRSLEAELGVAIVRRGRSYGGLTAEGEQVLATAHRLLREQETLRQELHGGADAPTGTLTIGAVPTALPCAARFAARLHALHPRIVPVVRSLSSPEIESGIDQLAIDLGLGYTERMSRRAGIAALPQYVESYFLLRRGSGAEAGRPLHIGAPITWAEAAALPLCLLTAEMHNRTLVDAAFAAAGASVRAAIETNSIVTMVLSVLDGGIAAVVPGTLMALVRGYAGLEALPLRAPELHTPIGFMHATGTRLPRALEAALRLAAEPNWLTFAAAHGGAFEGADR